jgi:hypothetical protein
LERPWPPQRQEVAAAIELPGIVRRQPAAHAGHKEFFERRQSNMDCWNNSLQQYVPAKGIQYSIMSHRQQQCGSAGSGGSEIPAAMHLQGAKEQSMFDAVNLA